MYIRILLPKLKLKNNSMEAKNEYSRIILEDEKLISELNNIFSKNREKKYSTIKFSDIKELIVTSWKPLAYVIYVVGLCIVGYGFSEKEDIVFGVIYRLPATTEEMVVFSILGTLVIALGYYFQIKYGKFKTLTVTHFEGKKKKTPVFTANNEKEIIDLKRELENRIYNR